MYGKSVTPTGGMKTERKKSNGTEGRKSGERIDVQVELPITSYKNQAVLPCLP